eukprot:COSAG06_NODE_313_length_17764_cov_4.287235_12_plen_376_part_00
MTGCVVGSMLLPPPLLLLLLLAPPLAPVAPGARAQSSRLAASPSPRPETGGFSAAGRGVFTHYRDGSDRRCAADYGNSTWCAIQQQHAAITLSSSTHAELTCRLLCSCCGQSKFCQGAVSRGKQCNSDKPRCVGFVLGAFNQTTFRSESTYGHCAAEPTATAHEEGHRVVVKTEDDAAPARVLSSSRHHRDTSTTTSSVPSARHVPEPQQLTRRVNWFQYPVAIGHERWDTPPRTLDRLNNTAWAKQHRGAITGFMPCCGCWNILPNGTFVGEEPIFFFFFFYCDAVSSLSWQIIVFNHKYYRNSKTAAVCRQHRGCAWGCVPAARSTPTARRTPAIHVCKHNAMPSSKLSSKWGLRSFRQVRNTASRWCLPMSL